MPDTEKPKEPQRAVIEYRERSFNKHGGVKFKRVIESARDADEACEQFWKTPVWPASTKGVEILQIEWL